MEKIRIECGEYHLNIREYKAEETKHILIGCHGLLSSQDIPMFHTFSRVLNKEGITLITFDFAGHGESEVGGEYLNYSDSTRELKSVMNYCRKKYTVPISLTGTSYGSEIAWNYAHKNKGTIEHLICMNAAIKRDKVMERFFSEKLAEIEEKGFIELGRNKLKITMEYIKGLTDRDIYYENMDENLNVIFIHGERDSMAPVERVEEFALSHNYELHTILGEDHVFTEEGDLISAELILNLFKDIEGQYI